MKSTIFRTVHTPIGLLEYRPAPFYPLFRAINRWFWLPAPLVQYVKRHALQRRINGGRWQFIQAGGA